MRRHWQYFLYVVRHKWFVLLAGLKLGVPLWMLILHDWDKFLPDEWFPYARCFYKPDGTKQYKESIEFAEAWMKHMHRNKHHWQWWLRVSGFKLPETNVLVWDRGVAQRLVWRNSGGSFWREPRDVRDSEVEARDPMPDVYRREMLADWCGAGRALGKPNTWEWYEANKDNIKIAPETRQWLEQQLFLLKESARQQRMFDAGQFG